MKFGLARRSGRSRDEITAVDDALALVLDLI
jgi:hypothetical protein